MFIIKQVKVAEVDLAEAQVATAKFPHPTDMATEVDRAEIMAEELRVDGIGLLVELRQVVLAQCVWSGVVLAEHSQQRVLAHHNK
jgi:hypothetical protein